MAPASRQGGSRLTSGIVVTRPRREKIEPFVSVDALIDVEVILEQSTSPLAALVAAAKAGDRDAFRRLVEPDLPAALGTARIVTRSEADASDAVQDALLSAWNGLDSHPQARRFPGLVPTPGRAGGPPGGGASAAA